MKRQGVRPETVSYGVVELTNRSLHSLPLSFLAAVEGTSRGLTVLLRVRVQGQGEIASPMQREGL